ncbi:MAG: tetratricopeptide repeat protein [Cyclobacteriaceae bacterium]
MKMIITFVAFIFWISANAQDKMDSLVLQLRHMKDDTNKVVSLIALHEKLKNDQPDMAAEYIEEALELSNTIAFQKGITESQIAIGAMHETHGDYDSALYFAEQAVLVSEKIENKKTLIEALTLKGKVLRSMSKWDEAIKQHLSCIELAKGDSGIMANSYNHIGSIYSDLHQLNTSLEYYQRCLSLLQGITRIKTVVIMNIGFVHYRLRNLDEANRYFLESVDMAESLDDKFIIAHGYQKVGLIKRKIGELDDAIKYYNLSIKQFEKINDQSMMAYLHQNIGNVFSDKKDYTTAIERFKLSLAIQVKIDDLTGQCYTLESIGTCYKKLGRYKESERYLLEAIDLSTKVGVQLIHMDATESLSELYAKQGRFEKAYAYRLEFQSIKDSIFNETKSSQIAEMETKYQTAEKVKEIELLNSQRQINELQLSKRDIQRNILIIAVLAVLILTFFLYKMYRIKAKSSVKLAELDQAKTNFFTNISHEFRTPLTLILGPLDQMIKRERDPEQIKVYQVMHKNASRLQELINQLLDLSKLDSGNMTLRVQKADINNFISAQCHSFDSLAEQKRIQYTISVSQKELLTKFDRDKVQKMVYNLLSNAFKFTPEQGEISLNAFLENEMYVISIRDSGKGITDDQLTEIFNRFHQVSETHDNQGSGVGLALTKELVELHHGEIKVSSQPGQGSEFKVFLPIEDAIYEKEEELVVEEEPLEMLPLKAIEYEESEPKSGLPIILVVDDNQDIRKFIRGIFEKEFTVIEAQDGKEGLEQAKCNVPDLIVSDVMMPGMDGMEFCSKIKSDELTSHVPVILLTAKAGFESKLEGLKTGADDYLVKPFEEAEFKVRIENLLTQRNQLRKRYSKMITLEPSEVEVSNPDEAFILKAQQIVEYNIPNFDFTVEQFQKEIGMSRMQLHRKLKALVNCSASEFIRDQRLQRAAQLLKNEGVNVSEVAYQSGFGNLSYFAKCFKEKFGKTPSQFS